jgi:hypothetical protein
MNFKKPYSQYIGKAILCDGKHKHFIIRVLDTPAGWIYFETVCISYLQKVKTQINDRAGFMIDSEEVELVKISEQEKHLIIMAAIAGVRQK